MEGFLLLDKFQIIAVPDTFAQLNPMPNLFMLGNRGDGEGMASCPRDQESYLRLNPYVQRIDSRIANGLGLNGERRAAKRVRCSRD